MAPADMAKLKRFQPFINIDTRTPTDLHFLEQLAGFNGLDNIDKHRAIHLTTFAFWAGTFGGRPPVCTNCWPLLVGGAAQWHLIAPGNPPKPDQEVLSLLVEQRGPNPHVDAPAELAGAVLVRGEWNVLEALKYMGGGVETILDEVGG